MEFTPRRKDAKKCDEYDKSEALRYPTPFGSRVILCGGLFLGRSFFASLRLRVRSN
jgi:hypothetical protein